MHFLDYCRWLGLMAARWFEMRMSPVLGRKHPLPSPTHHLGLDGGNDLMMVNLNYSYYYHEI